MPHPYEIIATSAPKVERLTYTKAETCAALGLAPNTLWRLEQRGLLMPLPGLRHKIYSIAAVKHYAEGK